MIIFLFCYRIAFRIFYNKEVFMVNTKVLATIIAISYSVIFGLSFLFTKKALIFATPFQLIAFRFLLAFIFMSILIFSKILKINYKNKDIKGLFFLVLMQPIGYFIFETYGLKLSTSSQAGILTALIPIISSIVGVYILKEIPSKKQWFFIILSVIGVIFIVVMDKNSDSDNSLLGTFLLLGAIICGSFYHVLSRKVSSTFTPIETTYFMMGVGAVTFNFISVITHIKDNDLSNYFHLLYNKDFLIPLLFLGILSSVIAFLFVNFSLCYLEASKCAVFSNLSTVISILAGVLFLDEKIYWYHIIGSITILIGVYFTNYLNSNNKNTSSEKDVNLDESNKERAISK
ncbi:EamA/RhaT family transporter [Clostridium tetani]|uniref:EamA/RhaT family transporter n=2 Tax=Clostridium tetani TaxID=1513 RepID=A0ABY0ERJ7_CLOTA|nr:EamA/RhaT family transporter [Clostridium tetani]RXI67773.1 EamA/RhaT family transporter [Clostridium tetani]